MTDGWREFLSRSSIALDDSATIRRSVVCVCKEIKIYLCKCEQSPVGFMDVCGKTRKLKRM